MLYIVKQYKALFKVTLMSMNGDAMSGKPAITENKEKEMRASLVNNKDMLINWVNSMESTEGAAVDGKLFAGEVMHNEEKFSTLLKILKLDHYDLKYGIDISLVVKKINNYLTEKQAVVQNSSLDRQDFQLTSEEVKFLKLNKGIKSLSDVSKIQIQNIQGFFVGKYELGNSGLNEDGVDGVAGTLTRIAYTDYKTKLDSKIRGSEVGLPQKEVPYENIEFNRILKEGVSQGPDVEALQYFLVQKGFLDGTFIDGELKEVDGKFGNGTKSALIKYQETLYGKGHEWADGIMSSNGLTKIRISDFFKNTDTTNVDLTEVQKVQKYGKEANEVVTHLSNTEKYLTAFNKVYGGQGETISRHNGLLGIINHLGNDDIDRLVDELKPDFSKVDNEELSKELGLSKNSDKYKDGLARIVIIAFFSALIDGGSSFAIEVFGINFGEKLSKGPEVKNILKALTGKTVDIKKEMKDMYIDESTTIEGISKVLDILNNSNMDTANLKRLMDEIYQPNWFQRVFGIFEPENYDEVERLIDVFENTKSIADAKNVIKEIYSLSFKSYTEAKVNVLKKEVALTKAEKEYKNNPYYDADKGTDYKEKLRLAKYWLKEAIEEFKSAKKGLSELGDTTSRYTNLDAKRAQIEGEKFDVAAARKREGEIDSKLGITTLKPLSKRLHSNQSFGYNVDIKKFPVTKEDFANPTKVLELKTYLKNMVGDMKTETINGKTSVIAGIIRGVEQHVFAGAVTFTPEEFIEAFVNTATRVDSKYVISNLGRDKNQKFQGKIEGNLFKMTINGKDVYFKDVCTNMVTYVNRISTSVATTKSIPIAVCIDTGVSSGSSGTTSSGAGSKPIGEDAVVPLNTVQSVGI